MLFHSCGLQSLASFGMDFPFSPICFDFFTFWKGALIHPSSKSTGPLLCEGVAGAVCQRGSPTRRLTGGGVAVLHLVASVHLELPGKGPPAEDLCALFYPRTYWFGFSVGGNVFNSQVCAVQWVFCQIRIAQIKAKDPNWAAWPLPITDEGEFPDLGLYAKDCINFAKKFLTVAGLQRSQMRQLPASMQASQQRSLEERTDYLVGAFCVFKVLLLIF